MRKLLLVKKKIWMANNRAAIRSWCNFKAFNSNRQKLWIVRIVKPMNSRNVFSLLSWLSLFSNRVKKASPSKTKTFHSLERVCACNIFFLACKVAISIRKKWVGMWRKKSEYFHMQRAAAAATATNTYAFWAPKKKERSEKKVPTRIEKKKQGVINRRQPNLESLCSRWVSISSVCVRAYILAHTQRYACV